MRLSVLTAIATVLAAPAFAQSLPHLPSDLSPTGVRSADDHLALEEVEGAMVTAVMMADSPEGPLSEELDARCELRDGGRHALCEIVGTPDGGGDGSWYGTLQPGYGNYVVLATKLPA